MKHLILTISLILFSCSKHEDHDTVNQYDEVNDKAASYLEQMKEYDDDALYPDRCDRLTFVSLSSSFVNSRSLSNFEYAPGEWHRDVSPCYSVGDSRSEISFDGLIGVLHHAWTSNDRTIVDRLVKYGELHDWVMGEGDREITYIPQLKILTADMLSHFNMLEMRPSYLVSAGTHNEHIIALSALLKLRYSGFLEAHDLLILKNLKRNPLITAILARVDDGNQAETIAYLEKFPRELPLETGIENWGGCPAWLYFFLLYVVINGL